MPRRHKPRLVTASPSAKTTDVAVAALRQLLDAVLHYLPRAAKRSDEDVEFVHQLRVWTRRSLAGLRLYGELLPRRRVKWIKRRLKRVRQAASDARDLDVLIGRLQQRSRKTHAEAAWLEAARRQREAAQLAVVAVSKRLRRDRFARRVETLLDRVKLRRRSHAAAGSDRFGDWAQAQLGASVERFFAAVPRDQTDEAAMHRFRIRAKELRYSVELLAGVLPPPIRKSVLSEAEAIQDRLGEINDLVTARQHLGQQITVTDAVAARHWQQLLSAEQRKLELVTRRFWKWCSAARLRRLRTALNSVARPARK